MFMYTRMCAFILNEKEEKKKMNSEMKLERKQIMATDCVQILMNLLYFEIVPWFCC